ncbi:MAG: hypothetical protein MZV64_13380 [Ignavibacteriales bacterium]|nr:hypothetical protein [Ignavibacteriales bacterium]
MVLFVPVQGLRQLHDRLSRPGAPGTATNISLTDWDIHHIVTGAEFFAQKIGPDRRPGLLVRQPGGRRPAGRPRAGRPRRGLGPLPTT